MATKRKKKKRLRPWVHNVLTVIICVLVAFGYSKFVATTVVVSGSSMAPTIRDGTLGRSEMLLRNVLGVKRGDIVIIDTGKAYLIKRVIGMPGDTIKCENNKVYINGVVLEEDYLSNNAVTNDFAEVALGEREYYCMGDNRQNSQDSRYYGPFASTQITGIYLGGS